ncbi:MAG: HNH endonuclease [Gemmatales bacterium]
MAQRNDWTRDQLLIALQLYLETDFGRLHGKNPEIIELANKIGRTPSALAMKACNFASIDPKLSQKGLSGASQADRALWQELQMNSSKLSDEMEAASKRLHIPLRKPDPRLKIPTGVTEKESLVRVRRVQSFFRTALLVSYESRCAISGIAITDLLVASHIIPWRISEEHRANPSNGILLNALFDRAFDSGFMTFDEDLRVVLSKRLKEKLIAPVLHCSFLDVEGQKLRLPKRLPPMAESLDYHRQNVFQE